MDVKSGIVLLAIFILVVIVAFLLVSLISRWRGVEGGGNSPEFIELKRLIEEHMKIFTSPESLIKELQKSREVTLFNNENVKAIINNMKYVTEKLNPAYSQALKRIKQNISIKTGGAITAISPPTAFDLRSRGISANADDMRLFSADLEKNLPSQDVFVNYKKAGIGRLGKSANKIEELKGYILDSLASYIKNVSTSTSAISRNTIWINTLPIIDKNVGLIIKEIEKIGNDYELEIIDKPQEIMEEINRKQQEENNRKQQEEINRKQQEEINRKQQKEINRREQERVKQVAEKLKRMDEERARALLQRQKEITSSTLSSASVPQTIVIGNMPNSNPNPTSILDEIETEDNATGSMYTPTWNKLYAVVHHDYPLDQIDKIKFVILHRIKSDYPELYSQVQKLQPVGKKLADDIGNNKEQKLLERLLREFLDEKSVRPLSFSHHSAIQRFMKLLTLTSGTSLYHKLITREEINHIDSVFDTIKQTLN